MNAANPYNAFRQLAARAVESSTMPTALPAPVDGNAVSIVPGAKFGITVEVPPGGAPGALADAKIAIHTLSVPSIAHLQVPASLAEPCCPDSLLLLLLLLPAPLLPTATPCA